MRASKVDTTKNPLYPNVNHTPAQHFSKELSMPINDRLGDHNLILKEEGDHVLVVVAASCGQTVHGVRHKQTVSGR